VDEREPPVVVQLLHGGRKIDIQSKN
jgi:hypothetical protein